MKHHPILGECEKSRGWNTLKIEIDQNCYSKTGVFAGAQLSLNTLYANGTIMAKINTVSSKKGEKTGVFGCSHPLPEGRLARPRGIEPLFPG